MNKVVLGILPALLATACATQSVGTTNPENVQEISGTKLGQKLDIGALVSSRLGSDEKLFHQLPSAKASIAIKLALITQAVETIAVTSEWISDDGVSTVITDALVAAADRGVDVSVVLDGRGVEEASTNLQRLLITENVRVAVYIPEKILGDKVAQSFDPLASEAAQTPLQLNLLVVDDLAAVAGARSWLQSDYKTQAVPLVRSDYLIIGEDVDVLDQAVEVYSANAHLLKPEAGSPSMSTQQRLPSYLMPVNTLSENLKVVLSNANSSQWFSGDLCVATPKSLSMSDGDRCRSAFSKPVASMTILATYPIVGEDGLNWLTERIDNDQKVSIVGNSLSASKSLPLFASYSADRKSLLSLGVELYEVKPLVLGDVEVKLRPDHLGQGASADNQEVVNSEQAESDADDKDFTWFKFGLDNKRQKQTPPSVTKKSEKTKSDKADKIVDRVGAKAILLPKQLFVGSVNVSFGDEEASGLLFSDSKLPDVLKNNLSNTLKERAYQLEYAFSPSAAPGKNRAKKSAYSVEWVDLEAGKAETSEPGSSIWDRLGVDVLQVFSGDSKI
ncbi:Cardiolipin synthase C [BD1-7 clade bacterium]|uniref:Cardiolipin synthase C n=1 Tax=BD1-7 clade bacterium TaxID=2029982 RepID=A0A5S9QTD0_9GAMM|nr:Cardiolipin synthase C [BD1-7 clade bacterium]CAA0122768.1 Cardiolipin synthase C [BD1-7 clade bacterium]